MRERKAQLGEEVSSSRNFERGWTWGLARVEERQRAGASEQRANGQEETRRASASASASASRQ